jgi:hypothetical protein
MKTLADLVPFPLAVSGRHGYWGASPMLEVLTYALADALETGESTTAVVLQIGGELLNERAPTPDQMDFDEDAYWERQRELQQALWESEVAPHSGDVFSHD